MKKSTCTLFLFMGMFTTLLAQQSSNYAGAFNDNQSIKFQDQPSLTPASFTMEAWVFISVNASNSMCIIGKNYGQSYYFAIASGNRVRFVPSKWNNGYLDSKPILAKEKWTHVAATYDGTTAKIYIDGNLDTSKVGLGSVQDTDHDLWIGRDREGVSPSYGFRGMLDEVRMWNRVLTQAEINENKHLSFSLTNDANAYKGLILNIPFCQADSFSTADVSLVPNMMLNADVMASIQPKTAADYLSNNVSLKLNGTNAYAAFAHDTTMSVANSNFTIEAWVYRSAAQLGVVYSKHNAAYNKGLTIAVNGFGNLSCKLNGSTTNSNAQLALTRWNHIAITFNGTSCTYYINGVLDKTFPMSPIDYVSDSAFIGKRVLGDAFFNGYIDELHIVKRAVTLPELREGMFRSYTYKNPLDSGSSFSFEGNVSNEIIAGQLMGGAQFSSAGIVGTPISPVLHTLYPDMKVQVEGMPIDKNTSVYTGSIFVDQNIKVEDVKVFVSMQHTDISHIRIRLINPLNDTLVLMQNAAPLNPVSLATLFDANAIAMNNANLSFSPAISPQNGLSLMHKRTAPGFWKLEVVSFDSNDVGVLFGWGIKVTGKDIVPTLNVSESSKTFEVRGYKAVTDSVIFSAEFLNKEVTLSIEAPFAIQLQGNAGYVQQITLPLSGDSITQRPIIIRYNPTSGISHTTYLKVQSTEVRDSVLLTGIVMLPTLKLSKDSLAPFTVSSINTTSAETSFSVDGLFLEDTLHIQVGGPFEISLTSGSGFDSTITIPVSQDTLAPVSIFVRYRPKAGTSHKDTLELKSGAIVKNLVLMGKVGPPTGLQELTNSKRVNCYPNPAQKFVTLVSEDKLEDIRILDVNGREYLHSKGHTFDVSGLMNGIYFVRVRTTAGIQTLRLQVAN